MDAESGLERASALRTLRVVVHALERHHLQSRELHRGAVSSVRALGEQRSEPPWQPLLAAFEGLARALLRYFRDQEDLVLDRVEWRLAERRLELGGLSDIRPYVERLGKHRRALHWHHEKLADELARGTRQVSSCPAGARACNAISAFAQAFAQYADFERHLLASALEPFLTVKNPECPPDRTSHLLRSGGVPGSSALPPRASR